MRNIPEMKNGKKDGTLSKAMLERGHTLFFCRALFRLCWDISV